MEEPREQGLHRHDGIRAVLAFLSIVGIFLAVDHATARLLGGSARWRAIQDPRTRILWDAVPDDSPIVLLGDSVFCSYFVSSPNQTLWNSLGRKTKSSVFPASLSGATPKDMVSMALRVAASWPKGSTVFVDIHPARIFSPSTEGIPTNTEFEEAFSGLVYRRDPSRSIKSDLDRYLLVSIASESFLFRNHEWILEYLSARLKGRLEWRERAECRNRRWDIDGDLARLRLEKLETTLMRGGGEQCVPVSWPATLHSILSEKELTPVFVLTPLNVRLIREYAKHPLALEAQFSASHDCLVRYLAARKFVFVDLTDAFPSEAFADAIHTNALGDELLAQHLLEWLSQRPTQRAGGVR
jgi:hypothetical protein